MTFLTIAHIGWSIYYLLAALFILVDVAIVVGFFYALHRATHFRPHYGGHGAHDGVAAEHRPTVHDAVLRERWHAILTKFQSGTPEATRLAIIEADALVDTVLKGMRVEGEHLADRLSNLETDDIKSMVRIWRAHRMRNDLVHTTGFAISARDADRTMQDYEAFLRELGVIE